MSACSFTYICFRDLELNWPGQIGISENLWRCGEEHTKSNKCNWVKNCTHTTLLVNESSDHFKHARTHIHTTNHKSTTPLTHIHIQGSTRHHDNFLEIPTVDGPKSGQEVTSSYRVDLGLTRNAELGRKLLGQNAIMEENLRR